MVFGTREVIGKAATTRESVPRIIRRDLGGEILGSAYGSDEGAAVGEGREEHGSVFAVVGDAGPRTPDSTVAACSEKGYAARAELCELVADSAGVGKGYGLLVVAIGRGNDLWDVLLNKNVFEPL